MENLNCLLRRKLKIKRVQSRVSGEISRGREDIKGEKKLGRRDIKRRFDKSFGTNNMEIHAKKEKPRVAYGETHPIWRCLIFKAWSGDKKWEMAKCAGLCYRCLGDNHLGKDCKRSRVCPVTGCNKNYHQMSHEVPNPKPPIQDPPPVMEGDACDKTTMATINKHEEKSVALRIVPIIN